MATTGGTATVAQRRWAANQYQGLMDDCPQDEHSCWRRRTGWVDQGVRKLSQEFDVVCLGGGVAGEAIAAGLQDSGLTLAVVERELVGGECPYWGCVPSKTLLRSGETLSEADRARRLAASRVEWTVDFPKVSKRVLWMARDLDDSRPAAAMEATGARLFRGEGKLTDLRTVAVGGEQLIARRAVVIANGSTAAIPPIPGLDTVEFWTNRQAAIPQGAAGLARDPRRRRHRRRAGTGLRTPRLQGDHDRSRTDVPWSRGAGGRSRAPAAPGGGRHHADDRRSMCRRRKAIDGASRERSAVVVHLKSGAVVTADRLLVATGRRPNVEAWRAAGLAQTERGWLKVDPATLEARPGVFGAGDVTGLGGFTHLAYYHGQVIARRLRGMDARADHTAVPRVTFTDPEIASVGLSEAAARAQRHRRRRRHAPIRQRPRAATSTTFTAARSSWSRDRERGVLVGATLVTPRAGEIVGELVLAIKLGKRLLPRLLTQRTG